MGCQLASRGGVRNSALGAGAVATYASYKKPLLCLTLRVEKLRTRWKREYFARPPTSENYSTWNFRKVETQDGITTMVLCRYGSSALSGLSVKECSILIEGQIDVSKPDM